MIIVQVCIYTYFRTYVFDYNRFYIMNACHLVTLLMYNQHALVAFRYLKSSGLVACEDFL